MRTTTTPSSRCLTALWTLLAPVVLSLWPNTAAAYILPADFLCRLVADSHKSSLKDATLTLSAKAEDDGPSVEERLYIKRPERMRYVMGPEQNTVRVAREALEATFVDKKLTAQGPTQDLLAVLMLPKGKDLDDTSQRILQALASVSVDTNVVTLARHDDGVAYVMGAHVWEPDKPQVWIDKASYMPVRMRLPVRGRTAPADKPVMREVRLLNYAGGFPRLIEVYENDKRIKRSEVTEMTINQNLPESLFDVRDRAPRP